MAETQANIVDEGWERLTAARDRIDEGVDRTLAVAVNGLRHTLASDHRFEPSGRSALRRRFDVRLQLVWSGLAEVLLFEGSPQIRRRQLFAGLVGDLLHRHPELAARLVRKIEEAQKLRQRVADEITTTFASSYTQEVSLSEALSIDAISVYGKQATGEKYLINPNKDL